MIKYSGTILILVCIIAIAGLAAYFTWNSFRKDGIEQIVSGNGRLEATEIDISTKFQGRVADVLYDEGDVVKKGEVLARIDTESLEAQLRESEARVNQAHKELAYAEAITAQRVSELDFSSKKYHRYKELFNKGIVSSEQLDFAKSQEDTSAALLKASEARIANAEASIKSAIAVSEKIKADISDCVLKAPRDGRVQYRLAEPGEVLPAGGRILTIIDLTDVYMTVFLPQIHAGKIAIGADARIVLDAFPDRHFRGTVTYVSSQAQFTPKQVETTSERQKLVFRTKVQLIDEDASVLKPGMPGVSYVRLSDTYDWPEHLK